MFDNLKFTINDKWHFIYIYIYLQAYTVRLTYLWVQCMLSVYMLRFSSQLSEELKKDYFKCVSDFGKFWLRLLFFF
jgi:hypothetical protein